MPGGDGTGPMGRGPMTGGGFGYCSGYGGVMTRRSSWGGFGRGMRRAFGWGRAPWSAPAVPPAPTPPPQVISTPQHAVSEEVILQCIVCNGPIYKDEAFLICPICLHAGHSSHMLEWVRTKGSCPLCRREMTQQRLARAVSLEEVGEQIPWDEIGDFSQLETEFAKPRRAVVPIPLPYAGRPSAARPAVQYRRRLLTLVPHAVLRRGKDLGEGGRQCAADMLVARLRRWRVV